MTIKTQYLAELKDVLAIRLTCSKCSGSVAIPVFHHKHIQEKCPNCHGPWFLEDSMDLSILEHLIKDCAALGTRGPDALCQIHLELNANGLKIASKDGNT